MATVSGRYGIALGSYQDIAGAAAETFVLDGTDTRDLMIRQTLGARLLMGRQGSVERSIHGPDTTSSRSSRQPSTDEIVRPPMRGQG